VQQKQGFATGISQPQPAQHEDRPEVQQKQGFATGISQPNPPNTSFVRDEIERA
jgi:hypothetical protein